jgi:hypothetical protein
MILNHMASGMDDAEEDFVHQPSNDSLLPALTYKRTSSHDILTSGSGQRLLDSRSTCHKRLPHMLRNLEYVIETPGTAIRLLLPRRFLVFTTGHVWRQNDAGQ